MYCGCEHEMKKEKCPAFGKTCTNCLKEPLSNSMHIQEEKCFKELKENETSMEVFCKKQEWWKNWTNEKRHYTKG